MIYCVIGQLGSDEVSEGGGWGWVPCGPRASTSARGLGNFTSQDFDTLLHSFVWIRRLRKCRQYLFGHFTKKNCSLRKSPQKLRGRMQNSWPAKCPCRGRPQNRRASHWGALRWSQAAGSLAERGHSLIDSPISRSKGLSISSGALESWRQIGNTPHRTRLAYDA